MCFRNHRLSQGKKTQLFTAPVQATKPAAPSCVARWHFISLGSNASRADQQLGRRKGIRSNPITRCFTFILQISLPLPDDLRFKERGLNNELQRRLIFESPSSRGAASAYE